MASWGDLSDFVPPPGEADSPDAELTDRMAESVRDLSTSGTFVRHWETCLNLEIP